MNLGLAAICLMLIVLAVAGFPTRRRMERAFRPRPPREAQPARADPSAPPARTSDRSRRRRKRSHLRAV